MSNRQSSTIIGIYKKGRKPRFLHQNCRRKTMRKQYLRFSFAAPRRFIEFPEDRPMQKDAKRHHTRSAPKLAVLYRINKFLQKSTKKIKKIATKKSKIVFFGTPKFLSTIPAKVCKNDMKIIFFLTDSATLKKHQTPALFPENMQKCNQKK